MRTASVRRATHDEHRSSGVQPPRGPGEALPEVPPAPAFLYGRRAPTLLYTDPDLRTCQLDCRTRSLKSARVDASAPSNQNYVLAVLKFSLGWLMRANSSTTTHSINSISEINQLRDSQKFRGLNQGFFNLTWYATSVLSSFAK